MKYLVFALLVTDLTTVCMPEIGSEKWWQSLKDKDKGDWTGVESKDYTKHCFFN